MKCIVFLLFILCLAFGVSAQVTFCGEKVPLKEAAVREKLLSIIKKNIKHGNVTGELIQKRMKQYLTYIKMVLKKYGLPEDLMFVPLVESRFDRTAESPAGAVGLWQIMPLTAKSEGLTVNKFTDERNSVIKSTHAACRLLLSLYKMFHSWTLACAAYNYGSGNLQKSIIKQKISNYYDLKLNPETGAYIYELVAMKMLYKKMQNKTFVGFYNKELSKYKTGKRAFLGSMDSLDNRVSYSEKSVVLTAPQAKKGWSVNGWGTGTVLHQKQDTLSPKSDTVIVLASVLNGGAVNNRGEVTFRTLQPKRIGNYFLNRNTLIPGLIYSQKGQIGIDVAGVDISPNLRLYDVKVFDYSGKELKIKQDRRGYFNIPEAYRVQLKFVKE